MNIFLFRHKMEFSLVQLKDHLKNTVEATCRGDPGAVFISSTVRTSIFATQVRSHAQLTDKSLTVSSNYKKTQQITIITEFHLNSIELQAEQNSISKNMY